MSNNLSLLFKLKPVLASAYFKRKKTKTSWNYTDVWKEANAKAFTVSAVASADILLDLKKAIEKAIDEGKSFSTFKKEYKDIFVKSGWIQPDNEPLTKPYRIENIYRTNIQSAYQAGRYDSAMSVKSSRPYIKNISVLDGRTTAQCKALDGVVFPIDSPVVDFTWPPSHYNCRRTTITLSEQDVLDEGIKVQDGNKNISEKTVFIKNNPVTLKQWTNPDNKETFTHSPGFGFNQSKEQFVPDWDKYTPSILRQLRAELKN